MALYAFAQRNYTFPWPGRWVSYAACGPADASLYFPRKGGSSAQAKRVCAGCPVRAECLDYALVTNQRYGVWGGTSERERRALRKERSERMAQVIQLPLAKPASPVEGVVDVWITEFGTLRMRAEVGFPDVTPEIDDEEDCCAAQSPEGFYCNRYPHNDEGLHMAADGDANLVAIWPGNGREP